jgi:hypothetical protein
MLAIDYLEEFMKTLKTLLLLLAFALPVWAQTSPSVSTKINEMKKLDYMIGEWKGTGWMERPGMRETFAGTEIIQSKVGGLALLVEGKFKDKDGKVVHETLAVISYNEKTKSYNFRTYLATGTEGEHELKLLEGGWQWGFQFPQGNVRFTFKLSDKGEWREIGEFSADGKTWRQFLELNLQKVK